MRSTSFVPAIVLTLLFSIGGSGPLPAATPAPTHSFDRSEDGAWALAGASRHHGDRGAAYIYRRSGEGWTLDAKLAPADRGPFARFGTAVALEGNLLLVGAPWDDGWRGVAYLYERIEGRWSLIARLAPDAVVGDRFGSRVAIAGGVASLGSETGTVARFQRAGAAWAEAARMPAGAGAMAPSRTVDPDLREAVAAEDARSGPAAIESPAVIDPPTFVRASDGVYEDRTEIRWAAVSGGPFLYKVYRRLATDPPTNNVLIRVASQDDSLHADTGGTPGVEYTYCVSVVDMANIEGTAACDNGRRIIFPPTGFTASDATFENFVRLRWSDRSAVEAGYRIRRDGDLLLETAADASAVDDSTAVAGISYSYELIAFDAAGNTTAPVADAGQSAFIGSPLQVSASDGQYPDRVVVTWVDATALETEYRVYRAVTGSGPAGSPLATLPPGATSYEDMTAVPGTTYDYCVAAVDAGARESARACDTGGIGVLPAPANVAATDGTFDDRVRITWRDLSDTEDGFLVYRMPVGTTDSVMVANLGAGTATFDDMGGEPGASYTYCVVAHSDQGGRSMPACDDGLRAIVLAPASVAATDGAFEDRVEITWESTSTSAVLFKIFRDGTFIRSVSGERRTYSDEAGPSGGAISYSVTAVTALGVESPPTADTGFRTIAAPVSVKASDDQHEDRVDLSWTDRSAIESGFFVYRRFLLDTVTPPERIAIRPANATTYSDRTGAPAETYQYFVRAFQAYGPGRADTTTSEAGQDAGGRALAVATFVEATDGSFENRVELSWVDNSRYEEAYHVWRRDTATDDSGRVAVLPPNASSWVDPSPAFAVVYEYSVMAVDSLGGQMLGTSPAGRDLGSTAILPPLGVSASDLYEDRVAVAWIDQSALETGFRVTRDGTVIGTVAANATSFTDNTAVPGIQYTYCVQSVAGATESTPQCDAGQRAPSTLDVASIPFTDLPGVVYNLGFDGFGLSLDGEGDWLIAGAPYRQYWPGAGPVYPNRGAVVALRQDGFGGILSGGYSPFTGSGGSVDLGADNTTATNFGRDVAIDGGWLFATYYVGSADRVAILRDNYPSPWTLEQILPLPTTGTGLFDLSIDVSGNTAVVTHPTQGVSFLQKVGSNPWASAEYFPEGARAVAMSGNTTLAGGAGLVRVYTLDGAWSLTQTLQPSSPDPGFGFSVDVDGERAVVGSYVNGVEGVAYVYERDGAGVWQPTATLQPDRTGTSFGFSVSIHGTTILVGSGTVYLYELTNGTWIRREVTGGPSGCFRCVQSVGTRGYTVKAIDGVIVAGAGGGYNDNNQMYIESRVYPLVAPVEPPSHVAATDNGYRDKVQITWQDNSSTEVGFRVYRDGEPIATVDPNLRSYTDFDAAPGRTYEYCVTAIIDSSAIPPGAISTESVRACDFGRRPPDGNITGRVSTLTGAGVSGVNVCLDPTPNRSILFDGTGGSMTVPDGGVFGSAFTLEFWYRGRAASGQKFVQYSTPTAPSAFAVNAGDVGFNMSVTVNGAEHILFGTNVNDGAWHHVAIVWASNTGAVQAYKDGLLTSSVGNLGSQGYVFESGGTLVFGKNLSGAMDEIRVWDHARDPAVIQQSRSEFLTGSEAGLSAYWPLNDSQGIGVEELKSDRYARLSGGAHWINESPPMNACAVSDVQGNYVLSDLRYGTSTTFKVTPSMEGHQYTPAFKTITLSTGSPVQNEVAFNDITSFTVSGSIRYAGSSCLAANVEIYVDDQLRGTTDGNGRYAVPVPPGTHRLEARLAGHTYQPAEVLLQNVAGDVTGQDFVETTERRLTGTVGGGCNLPIGTLTLRLDSENGCISRTFDTSVGFAEVLPPLKYFVRVTHVTAAPGGPDAGAVTRFFDDLGAREVDLSSADQVLDFKYRAPLRVEIAGLPDPDPTCTLGVPVIAQMERYPLTIRVAEDYGSLGTCPVDSGSVTVFDEILDQERSPVTLVVKNGLAYLATADGLEKYVTAGNTPNIFAGRVDAQGNDRSYQKSLTVVAEVPGQDPVTATAWAVVTGQRPRTATFTSVSDGIPLIVLRDPPGDHSFSFTEQESTFCTKVSNVGLERASAGFEGKIHVGIKFILGFGYMTTTVAKVFLSGGLEVGLEAKQGNEFNICAKTTEQFKTSDDMLYIGRDGDVFVGLALNVIFAKTDVVRLQGCDIVTAEEIAIGVDDVETVYNYTDWHIRNTIIPQLTQLVETNPADSVRFLSARRNWEAHLALNDSLKSVAPLERNRSFSAGADFSYSSSVEETRTSSWSINAFTNAELAQHFEFNLAGSGAETKWYTKMTFSYERAGETSVSRTRTTGYTLADDDIGDFFSVNVKKDPLYGTPVFDLLSGTSSCPWEPWPHPLTGAPRTQPVDGARLTVEPPGLSEVPVGSPAVFTLNLTNDSEAEGVREYQLYPVGGSNPGGAVLKIDGAAFANGVSYFLDPAQTREVTLTVERGPNRYFYNDLKIAMVAPCEYALWRNGGALNRADTVSISVGFEAPCSDITLLRPNPGWSVGAGQDTLELLLTDFELAISERDSLVSIGAEYQLAGTDAWLPIGAERTVSTLPRDAQGRPLSVAIHWPVTAVPEGTYTVRAFTRCDGRNYSAPATGVIDRAAPQVFGTPEPADGTLSFGENIAITFNEDIDCASAAGANVRLETTAGTPQPLGVRVVCNGRTLVIEPTSSLAAHEGQELRAMVQNIRDRVGNVAGPRTWLFTVRQGEFAWSRSDVSLDAGYGAGGRIAVNLVNGLSQKVHYTLSGLPAWLTAEPAATDTIPARSQAGVAFQVDPATALGSYDATITATATTDPPSGPRTAVLDVHLNVLRVPPTWTVDPADYEHSMTVRAKVYVGADSLISPDDVLAAFVGEQVRGVAHPQLVSDGWRYFLTVYGKPPAYERVRFRVWDSRTSQTWVATDKTLRFAPDSTLGAHGSPFEIRTRQPSPAIEQVIAVNAGWTWFSVNRRPAARDDRTVAAVLSNLVPSPGDLVKAQDGSIAMFDAVAGWVGTLDTLGVTKSYRLRAAEAGLIRYESVRVLPSAYPIPVHQGWNWIGYTPDDARPLSSALANLAAAGGDILRSQTAFAEYAPSLWAGSLAQMAPGLGYALYRSNPVDGQFTYADVPPGPALLADANLEAVEAPAPESRVPVTESAAALPGWEIDPGAFQHDMVVIAEITGLTLGPLHQVAAVVDGEIRGVARPVQVPARGRSYVFLMVRSNRLQGETVRFQALDRTSGEVFGVEGGVDFAADAVMGSTAAPVPLRSEGVVLTHLGGPVAFELGASQPNPVLGAATAVVRYGVPREARVSIELFDINGRRVRTLVDAVQPPGWHEVGVDPGGLRGGVYFYRMRADSYSATRRMVVVR